ncbi:MAG: lysine 5,6-aminomutase subunit alpha [Proteobacteria bacterium]|nr:lysine 5,6-aminomutase subunit alpha [Pseudomonadota bacterium]
MARLRINSRQVSRMKKLATEISSDVQELISRHSSVSIERTILRLYGVDGVDEDGTPIPNLVADRVKEKEGIENGISHFFAKTMAKTGKSSQKTAEMIVGGKIDFSKLDKVPQEKVIQTETALVDTALHVLDSSRERKHEKETTYPSPKPPLRYLIVATGNIYEDRTQAESAVTSGADIIAVIRSTAQSLLDYIPHGPTTEGFGGTFATQANFRIMREALDRISEKEGRFIRLVNYASGLCMPEIAACAAYEDLDILLNDSMYGILFRDINMKRTFVDQYFSRLICARANIMINTGEDNYLTTADAIDNFYTVTTSQMINEAMAKKAGLSEELIGLGHAFEVDPEIENSFLYELAHAQLTRQLFPRSPVKYMPPTRYKSTDIFYSHTLDTLFNLASILTDQGIHLAGILTEAIHTPLMQDRHKSLSSINYVFNTAASLKDEIEFKRNGFIEKRTRQILGQAEKFLKEIQKKGLMKVISEGKFADIKRSKDSGKGLDGVFEKGPLYSNPIMDRLEQDIE